MKNLAFIFAATLFLGVLSCTKTIKDPPPPVDNYTIKYSVVSVDSVDMDTIECMDIDGSYIYVIDENHFELSFVHPSTNYHGDMYISGTVIDVSCNYSLIVEAEDGSIVHIKENATSSTYLQWWASFSHVED